MFDKLFFMYTYTVSIKISLHLNLNTGLIYPNKPFVPAHVVQETVGTGHAVQLVLVFLQKVSVALFRNKF